MSSDRVSFKPLEQMVKFFHVFVYSFLCEEVIVCVCVCVCISMNVCLVQS